MEVYFAAETEEKLKEFAARSGRGGADDFVREVVEGYFDEVSSLGTMLASRYGDLKGGRVQTVSAAEVRAHFRAKSDAARTARS